MATDVRTPAAPTTDWRASNAQVAQFRTCCQVIHDALAAVGLVQTADTGQANLATIAGTGAAHQSMGYEIWRFNDTLQATAPIFIKVEYGGGSVVATGSGDNFAVWITVGTGTNGAGTLTGKVSTRRELQTCYQSASFVPASAALWTSGASGRVAQCIARNGSAAPWGNAFWAVERTKDAAGADTNEGFHLCLRASSPDAGLANQPQWYVQTIIFAIAGVQTQSSGPMCVVSNDGTASDAADVGYFPWCMASRRGNENPPLGWLSYFWGDVAGSSDVVVNVYGANHTYKTLGSEGGQPVGYGVQKAGWRPLASIATVPDDSVHFAMRWE